MLFTTQRTATASLLALTLSACGGGGGGGDNGGGGGSSTPQANSGYAQPTDQIRNGVLFTSPSRPMVKRTATGPSLEDIQPTVRYSSAGPGTIYVTVEGEEYSLQKASDNSYTRDIILDGERTVMVYKPQMSADNNVVEGGFFSVIQPNSAGDPGTLGHIVFGYDTNPTTISAETGSAYYSGTIHANGYQDGTVQSTSGNMTLSANFDSNTVNGSFNLGNMSGITGAESYKMESTAITGNGFSGNITVTDGSLQSGQTLQNGGYQGNFYGSEAEAVGGTINMTIQDGAESPIFIQGGFVADEVLP